MAQNAKSTSYHTKPTPREEAEQSYEQLTDCAPREAIEKSMAPADRINNTFSAIAASRQFLTLRGLNTLSQDNAGSSRFTLRRPLIAATVDCMST